MPIPNYNYDSWKDEWQTADTKKWKAAYDKAFHIDRKTFGWKRAIEGGQIPVSDVQQWALGRLGGVENVLDVGCGPGYFGLALASQQKKFFAVDISPACIKFAKSHVNGGLAEHFAIMAIEDLDKHHKQYDAVTCFELLEHVKDPEASIQLLWNRVKDGGKLIITTPVEDRVPSPFHIHSYDEGRIHSLLQLLGEKRPTHVTQVNGARWAIEVTKSELAVRYVQVAVNNKDAQDATENMANPDNLKSGYWNWMRALNGEAKPAKEILKNIDEYDVIHCQIAGATMGGVHRIAKAKKPHTQLIAQVDYSVETWNNLGQDMDMILDTLRLADWIFAVEPLGAKILSVALDTPVWLLQHPIPVEAIQKARVDPERRWGCLIHAHRDSDWFTPYWACKDLNDETVLGGYAGVEHSSAFVALVELYYDHVWGVVSGDQYVRSMAGRKVCFDAYRHHVYGRVIAEAAALGVPTVGYSNAFAMWDLFPELMVPTGDVDGASLKLKRLYNDPQFYKSCAEYAQERVEKLNLTNSAERFMAILNDGEGDVYSRSGNRSTFKEIRPTAGSEVAPEKGTVGGISPIGAHEQPVSDPGAGESGAERRPKLSTPGQPAVDRVAKSGYARARPSGAGRVGV